MEFIESFLLGFRAREKVPRSKECTENLVILVREGNYTSEFLSDPYRIWHEKAFNASSFISNAGVNGLGNCTLAGYESYRYILERNDRFEN